ncbi:MAG: endonuclease MutS2, partial [Acidobacteria bacterium]|nr:endonuclease MutS2 [Acidobacteriota bacterium]
MGILRETSAAALEWQRLREQIARLTGSAAGRDRILALEPSIDPAWIAQQQDCIAEVRLYLASGAAFYFTAVFAPGPMLEKARIPGAALEPAELLRVLALAELMEEWRAVAQQEEPWKAIAGISLPVTQSYLAP